MELNPNHPVTQLAHDNWHKVCALILCKLKIKEVEITLQDVVNYSEEMSKYAIVIHDTGTSLKVYFVSEKQQKVLLEKEGGKVV